MKHQSRLKITGQRLHELAMQKIEAQGHKVVPWKDVPSKGKQVYHFVAQQLNQEIVKPLQQQLQDHGRR